ncbi:hypothetical protein E4T41_05526 [Aureobasidium subglaciale]|nr:hypothetical protein E4T41_05526 [Aureobasidium subglaciale]
MPPGARRTRPCDACRKRKTKCHTEDSERVCVLCRFHGQRCTYEQNPRPRRRTVSSAESISGYRTGLSPHTTRTIPGTGVEEYDALPDGTTLLKRTLGLQNLHHSQYLGVNNSLNVCGLNLKNSVHANVRPENCIKVRYVHQDHAFKILSDASVPVNADETSVLDAIESSVYGHGPDLVDLYFRIVHPAFPILHKQVFLEKYARSYREFSPPLLAAVYLLASGYWSYSDSLNTKSKPPTEPLKRLALDSLHIAMQRAKLSTIQACLLISQEQATDFRDASSETHLSMTSQLVQLAHRLGLHLDAAEWDIPEWEIGLRRRLSWAVFMQEKWLALVHGRPSLISSETWDVGTLEPEDFPETDEDDTVGSSEVEKGRLVFMHMAGLAEMLSDLLVDLFSPRAQRLIRSDSNALVGLLERIKPLQIRLKDWFATLPEGLKKDTATSMKLSSVGYLRLAYLAIEASIHRQITLTLVQCPQTDSQLITICRNAARERFTNAFDFLNGLQASHLASFWYLTSPECAATIYHLGSLLETLAEDMEEKENLGQMLKACRWAFKVNREAGASFTRHALSLLDASERVTVISTGESRFTASPSTARDDMLQGLSPASMIMCLAATRPTAGGGPLRRTLKWAATNGCFFKTSLRAHIESCCYDSISPAKTLCTITSRFMTSVLSVTIETMEVAVVGTHLSGFPLNQDITCLNATFKQSTTTSPNYRLFELQGTIPAKPGLMRVSDGGARIEIEIWAVPIAAIGTFLSTVPSPLGLGTIEIYGGRWVKGFICEPYGLEGAKDITEYGGWRKFKERS